MTEAELLALIDQAAEEGWTELDLSGKGLTVLPPEIGKLTQLEKLVLGKVEKWEWKADKPVPTLITNELSVLPPELAQLKKLCELDVSGNALASLPKSIVHLIGLEMFSAVSIGLTEIPESLNQLRNLTTLALTSNQLTEIPEGLSQLRNLTKLALASNQLTEIPESLSQLRNLTTLYLDSNQLTEIPESLSQLRNLTTLYLSSNQLTEIPEGLSQPRNLTTLYLYNNQLTEIPEGLSQLRNLTILSLSSNQLTEIPEGLSQLRNLTTLFLSSNQLTEIPEGLSQLRNLTILSLSSNQLTEIPESLSQLRNLTELYLDKNQLTEIPESLERLSKLERLYLFDNQLPISPEILGNNDKPGSPADIFAYCQRMRSGEVGPLNEAKLLLVGQGSVGKTSLIERLLYNRHHANQSQTDGLNVLSWGVIVNNKDVRLNVWDFGGQEVYHSTHQFFLTKRSLYILACNCRTSEEENRIEYWLKLIKSFGGESPVIIVGNKCDEQPLDINRKALRTKYPNIKAILETSCQTNEGISELHAAIEKEVAQMNDVYNLLPLSWFQVKEQLEAIDKDFISYPEYLKICFKNNITEETDQDQLIDLLHNLGLVLNFRDHPILQNTKVLNPDWVTAGIYALLSDDTLKTKNKGILTTADLTRVLDSHRYPEKRHKYLTELMQEFQLCYALPHCPATRFLIPGLLPKDEPDDITLPDEADSNTLDFQYHYRILPGNILSRFIVLSHEKIYNNIQWRSGVLLTYSEGKESNFARVRADIEDKKIFITINGSQSTRRSFLFLIRDTFTKIHSSFTNLEISEWVPVPGHPEHPPLDYQELIGLEAMGVQEHPIGKLRIKVNIRQLLDGYESLESRRLSQLSDREKEEMLAREELAMRHSMVSPHVVVNIDNNHNNQNIAGNKNNASQIQGNDNISRQSQGS